MHKTKFNREDFKTVLPQLEKRIDKISSITDDLGNKIKNLVAKVANIYPIGSVYITNTNEPPQLDGTWTLFDKAYKTDWISDEYFTWNTTNANPLQFAITTHGHSIEFRISWENKIAVSDTTIDIGTFDMEEFSTTGGHIIYPLGFADGLNGVALMQFNLSSVPSSLQMHDLVTRSEAYPSGTGSTFRLNYTYTHNKFEDMVDDKCDKFYWKRTA